MTRRDTKKNYFFGRLARRACAAEQCSHGNP